MSEVLEKAQKLLGERFGASDFTSTAKFVIEGAGELIVEDKKVRAAGDGDENVDVTITASAEVLEEIFDGELDGTAAYMSGRLVVDGDIGLAMELGRLLS